MKTQKKRNFKSENFNFLMLKIKDSAAYKELPVCRKHQDGKGCKLISHSLMKSLLMKIR